MLEITPAKGWTGEATDVVIGGLNFYPRVQAEARGDGAEINRTFEAWLEQDGERIAFLDRVSLTDSTSLAAQVPEGIAPRQEYDLIVSGPNGGFGMLEDAFLVTATRADHFVLTNVEGRPYWTVKDQASFEAQVVDPAGDPLLDAVVPVRVSVEPVDDTPIQVVFEPDILLGQTTAEARYGAAIEGRLDLAGRADIDFSVQTPAGVLLKVEALDPGIEPAAAGLLWTTGTDYSVDVALPAPNYSTLAGERFAVRLTLTDENDIIAWDPVVPITATLIDNCNELVMPLGDFAGIVDIDVALQAATGTSDCAEQRLEVLLSSGQRFQSTPITVNPGPTSQFAVTVAATEVTAGTPLNATVRPVDAYGNASVWEGVAAALRVGDTIGDIATRGCSAGDAFMSCTVTPTDAEYGVMLIVRDPSTAVEGASQPYDVLAADLDRLTVVPNPSDLVGGVVAGDPLSVTVGLLDEYDNDVPTDEYVDGDITLSDEGGAVSCEFIDTLERGQLGYECVHYRADDHTVLVAGGPGGVRGQSSAFAVVNAELGRVLVTPSSPTVVAGEPVDVAFVGLDEYGNPYKVHTDNRVDLRDSTGSLSIDHTLLDTDGASVESVRITTAGPTTLIASQFGVDLGASDVIDVSPDAASQLSIESQQPWGWVDGQATIVVQATDRYGNPADADEDALISATAGTFAAETVTLVDGRGQVLVDFTTSSLSESVQGASDSGLKGTSGTLYVVEDCGSFGPTAAVSFGGSANAVVCHDGTEASTTASFVGSSPGSTSLSRYALWVEGEGTETGSTSSVDMTITQVGIFEARALVIDAGLCADEVVRSAYVGPDDGQPVGPLDVSLSTSTLAAGTGTSTVSVSSVETCDGDPASGGRVYFRADRGEVAGATASGQGLRLSLDSSGDGSLTLDASGEDTDGSGTVTLWVESGAAAGAATFSISGDTRRPRVVHQDPVGYTTDSVDLITLTFSEPIDASTVRPGAFSVSGPSLATIDEVLRSGDREVEIWLDAAVSGADARWTVEASSSITDVAGNALDGSWTGGTSAHSADFGKVASAAPDVTRCGAPKAFRPDGDDGSGIEADSVDIAATADTSVSTWSWSVFDADGDEVFVDRKAGTTNAATLVWSGRSLDGSIVDDGTYSVRVSAENGDGTVGDWCSVKVAVDNRRGL